MSDLTGNDLVLHAQLRDELSQPLRGVRRELERTTRSVSEQRDALGRNVRVGRDFERGLSGIGRTASGTTRNVGDLHRGLLSMSSSLGGSVARGIRTGTLALGALGAAAGVFGLRSASQLETGRIQLEALTGSAEEAGRVFEFLKQLDPVVPFDIGQLQQATVQLSSAGIAGDALQATLRGVTDVAAATADPGQALARTTRALAQMSSAGTVLAEELNQLVDAGVAVGPAMQQAYGMTMAEFRKAQQGGGANLAPDAFFEALFGMRAGTAERVATETLTGLWSGVKSRITLRLADSASPFVTTLKDQLPALEEGVGGLLETVGPPLFTFLGDLTRTGTKLLPIIGPPLEALASGVGMLLGAAGPGLAALTPLGEQLSASIGELVTELVPVMPDLVDLFIALVGVAPEFIGLLADMVPLVGPVARLATALLAYEPVTDVMAGLLLVLLGYRAVAGLVGGLQAFAAALGYVGTQATVAGTQAQVAQGRFAGLGRTAGIVGGVGGAIAVGSLAKSQGKKGSLGEDLALVGTGTATGAAIGSIVPGLGTAIGAGGGAAVTGGYAIARRIFGDVPMAPGAAAGHGAAMAMLGGGAGLQVTSGLRGFGVRGADSKHLTGQAVDVAGSGLGRYMSAVRSLGGAAKMHGNHAHTEWGDTPMAPRAMSLAGGGGAPVSVTFTGPINGIPDLRAAIWQVWAELDREREERARSSLRGRDPWRS